MSRKQALNQSGPMRQTFGCLVTFENAVGDHLTLHRTGPLVNAVKTACAIALAEDESYRVVCYSTPETIATDLSGGRTDVVAMPRADHLGVAYEKAHPIAFPEAVMLGRCGLRELLHPRLRLRLAETDY